MVWIYGGGLVTGAASIYPGSGLARQGIVVVTFDYRLGRLGFFAHPALARESPGDPRGNYGYLDQLAALKWVQHNIAAFGGDPENVTIAGESAGGGSALVLLTSPMARGLFARAILQSPGIPTARAEVLPMRSLGDAEKIARKYALARGIEATGRAALAALRALPADTLIAGTEDSIVDGRLVVETPEAALLAGKQAQVPVIVGANDYDLAVSSARSKDELFAIFGSFEARARAFYDPGGAAKLATLEQNISAHRALVEPSRHSRCHRCAARAGGDVCGSRARARHERLLGAIREDG
jgi:para-nitrobenzyl esterase